MKYIGFIKEHNNIKEAIAFNNIVETSFQESVDHTKTRILEYLNKGVLLLGWMGYFVDIETKELISPDSYYTDGICVWPSYFPHYFRKYPCMKVDAEFIEYLKERKFEFKMDASFFDLKNKLEDELSKKLSEAK